MATLPDSESMSSRTFARSSISRIVAAAGADDDADTVLRNRHVLHMGEYPAKPFKRVPP